MSAIWSITKDVITATWRLPSKRLMGIFLRLSIVVGLIMTGVSLADMYLRYNRQVTLELEESYRIYNGLICAQAFADEELLKHVNQFGNFDISKVGCSRAVFWANLKEVRSPRTPEFPNLDYRRYVQPLGAVVAGASWMVVVIALGTLTILMRSIALWVIGIERT